MANRVAFQAAQTKFSVEIFSRRQRKRHQNTNILCFDCQFADSRDKKEVKKELGIFKLG